MKGRWFSQPERGSLLAVRIIRWITLHIGRWAARLLLYPITLYFLLTGREQRRSSRRYLRRALDREPGIWDIARHFHCFAATILDRVYLIRGDRQRFDLRLHGASQAFDGARSGQGCLLLGSHLGSFEVTRMLAAIQDDVKLKVLMYEEHNPALTGVLHDLNPEFADTVIGLGRVDALLAARESLNNGEMIGILGDRVAESDKVTTCRFLGDEATFPSGPMLLASMLEVPVILFFGLYRGGNRYELHFELFSHRVTIRRDHREEDIQKWTQRYAERLEFYARRAPYNWFNFYEFWGESPPPS